MTKAWSTRFLQCFLAFVESPCHFQWTLYDVLTRSLSISCCIHLQFRMCTAVHVCTFMLTVVIVSINNHSSLLLFGEKTLLSLSFVCVSSRFFVLSRLINQDLTKKRGKTRLHCTCKVGKRHACPKHQAQRVYSHVQNYPSSCPHSWPTSRTTRHHYTRNLALTHL